MSDFAAAFSDPYDVLTGAARIRMQRAVERGLGVGGEHVGTFHDFVGRRNPDLLRYEHVPRLVSVGQRIADGLLSRVLVLLAPRYFKTEVFGRLLPAYVLRRSPNLYVGLASYGASLAWDTSAEARDYYRADGGQVSPDTDAKHRWDTTGRGGMWAAGVGGPMLGFGYHLGVVDDPTDPEKAHSPTYQRRFTDWWPGKFLSRQEPGAALVFVMQRLGTDDPVDFILRREVGEDTDEAPEHWHVVVCEEVKSDAPLGRWGGPRGLPPTCTIEPDPRAAGEVLAPSRFTSEQVEALQRSAGPYVTAAQRQQRPAAPQGDFWRAEWFTVGVYDELPAHAYNGGKDWDTAYTKNERNSASAWIETYRGPGGPDSFPIYVEDCGWDWWEFPELVAQMKALAGPHHIEAKATGKSAAQSLRREQIVVHEVTVDGGDKLARASLVQPVVAQGRIRVRRALLRKLLHSDRQGLLRVTAEALATGRGDLDLNDVFVQAIVRHTGGRQRRVGVLRAGQEGGPYYQRKEAGAA